MKRSVFAAAAGLVLLTGCGGTVIGADGPKPGLAAEVEGTELTLADLTTLTDAECTLREASEDPNATVTRAASQRDLLLNWLAGEMLIVLGEKDGDVEAGAVPSLEGQPGWDQLTDDEQQALTDYVTMLGKANTVYSSGAELDPTEFDYVVNPRFDLDIDAELGAVDPDQELSVAVSDEAKTEDQPTPDELAKLPDAQLCGIRPDAAPAQQLPFG